MTKTDDLFNGEMTEDDGLLAARQEAATAQQKRNQETAAKKDAALKPLLAELGGDNPQNRAIAEGLFKQGVGSTKDIQVKQIDVPGYWSGSDESTTYTPDTTRNVYFNKANGQEINPTRLGVYQVDKNGKAQGDIFFHLNADDKGNVSFQPQWSPRAHGFLRDNPIGQAIMAVGKIIPATSPFFLAASAIDAAAHGNYGAAIANLVPMGLQQLASGTDVLTQLAGPDFNPTAVTPGGQIAEALGVPVQVADQVGKAATQAVKAGLSGKDAGEALLKSGIGSLVGTGVDYLKEAGGEILNDVKGGITTLFGNSAEDATEGIPGAGSAITYLASPPNPGETDFNYENQQGVNTGAAEKDVALPDTSADKNGIGGLNIDAKDSPTGGISDLKPVAYDEEGNMMPGYELDSEGNAVWMGGGSDYVSPEGGGMVDDAGGVETVDGGSPEYSLGGGAGNDYVSPPSDGDTDGTMVDDAGGVATVDGGEGNDTIEGGGGNSTIDGGGGNDTLTGGGINDIISTVGKILPVVPAIFPPKKKEPIIKTVTPTVTGKTAVDTITGGIRNDTITGGGSNDTLKGGGGNDTIKGGGGNDGLTGIVDTLLGGTDALKGKYNFSWNQQQTKAPEKGVAYSQRYFGNHWNKSEPTKNEMPQTDNPTKMVAIASEDPNMATQFAEGGLMALDKTMLNTTFKPTMTDSGIQASDLTKQDVANEALQHMRRGGHVIDHKAHRDVHYLASKGEPVHHIVGFMNHRKRMAEGGITSHSLGSYSDGGHLLKGPGDGMSDDIPATIADKQPARLANEEFVIPADVVSHLGNGSSESGAKVLYEMMAKIRKARTGNPKQGKQIDPHKLMPKV